MYIIACYTSYLAISIALTIWIAHTLFTNGRAFLIEAFHGNQELADSVNKLLVVGFYLVNVGCIAIALRTEYQIHDLRGLMEIESVKLGAVLFILGLMHTFNVVFLAKLRARAQHYGATV